MRTMGPGWLKAVDEMTWWRASEDDVDWMAQGCRRDDMVEGVGEQVRTIGCWMAQGCR